MSRRAPRLSSAAGRAAFKAQTGVELPPEPTRDARLAAQLADAALLTDEQMQTLLRIVERTRQVLSATEHRVLKSFVVRGIEAPKQLRAALKVSEPGRDGALAKRDRENAALISSVEQYARRHRCSITEACKKLASRLDGTGTSLERRYYRAKKNPALRR